MTNQLILSIVKEEKLLQWTRVEEAPPYSEIEVLRALDQLQAEASHQFSDDAIAALYTMLAYHRLDRHHRADDLTINLLERSQKYKKNLTVRDSLQFIMYFNEYFEYLVLLKII